MIVSNNLSAKLIYLIFILSIGLILYTELFFYFEINLSLIEINIYIYSFIILLSGFTFLKFKQIPMKSYIIIMVIFIYLCIISTIMNANNDLWKIVTTSIPLLSLAGSIYISYKISYNLNNNFFIKAMIFIFIFIIFIYFKYYYFNNMALEINTIYYVLLFLPFCASIKKLYIKIFLISLIFFATFISTKRTAFLACIAFIAILYIANLHKTNQYIKKSVLLIISIIIIIIFICNYNNLAELTGKDIFFRLNLNEMVADKGSGRLDIYKAVWTAQINSSFIHWILGSGYNGVINDKIITTNSQFVSAHNDFLEVLYDYGIFGLCLYIFFLLKLFIMGIKLYHEEFYYANEFLASIGLYLCISLTSHLVIYPNYFLVLLSFFGICLGQYERLKFEDKTKHKNN